jgi:hypothetical protein
MVDDSILTLAASGDYASQVALRDTAMQNAGVTCPMDEGLTVAETMARLVAARGDGFDVLTLCALIVLRVSILEEIGDVATATARLTEAAALMEQVVASGDRNAIIPLAAALSSLADHGDEAAALKLNSLMDALAPEDADAVRSTINARLSADLEAN